MNTNIDSPIKTMVVIRRMNIERPGEELGNNLPDNGFNYTSVANIGF